MKTNCLFTRVVAVMAAVGLMFQGAIPLQAAEQNSKPSIDIFKVRVPEIYGTVKMAHKGNDKVVFYLQDAHCNLEAQQNNSRILQDLISQYGVDTVCVEGSAGPIETSDLTNFPDKDAMADVASYFMSQGRISGAEYLAITGDKPFSLVGLEDKALYDQNKQAFTDSIGSQKESVAQTAELSKALGQIADKVYSADLKTFVDKVADYRSGKIKFTEHAQAMRDAATKHSVDISAHKNFALQGASFDMEGKINFDAVEDERSALVDEVSKKLSKEDSSNLVVQSLSFRLGRLSATEYYDVLKKHCEKTGVDLKAKANLAQYIEYIKTFEGIDKDALVDEANAVEAAIKDKLFANDDQRKLDKMIRHMDMIGRMFEIKLGIRDYKVYAKSAADNSLDSVVAFAKEQAAKNGVSVPSVEVASLQGHVSGIEKFYAIAAQRDEVLAKNAIEMMKDKDRIAMVTGGFHTGAIADKLKSAGLSVVVITPRITDFDVQSPYVDVMTGKATNVEKMFKGETIEAHTLATEGIGSEPLRKAMKATATKLAALRAVGAALEGKADDAATTELNNLTATGGVFADIPGPVDIRSPARGVYVFVIDVSTGKRVFTVQDTSITPNLSPAVEAVSNGLAGRDAVTLGTQQLYVGEIPATQAAILNPVTKIPGTGVRLAAKVAGATADAAYAGRVDAAIEAAYATGTQNVTAAVQALLASRTGSPTIPSTVEFVTVDDTAVLLDNSFNLGTTVAHAQIKIVSDGKGGQKAIIGIPKALFDTTDTVELEHKYLALVKDVVKAESILAGDDIAVANMKGLMAEAAISKARILGSLQHYIDAGKITELINMATQTSTDAAITKAAAYPDELKAFATGLAKEMQAYIPYLLLRTVNRDATKGAAVRAALTSATGEDKAVADVVLALVTAGEAALAKGAGAKMELTDAYIEAFTFDAIDKAKVDQATEEVALMKQLGAVTSAYDSVASDLAKGKRDEEFTSNIRNLIDYDVIGGKATNFRPKSANAHKRIEEMLKAGTLVNLYSTDLTAKDALKDLVVRGLGLDVSGYEKSGNFFLIQSDSALNADSAIDTKVAAASKVRPAKNRRWAAYQGDDVATLKADTAHYKVLIGQPGVSFDQVVAFLLMSGEVNKAALEAALRETGVPEAEIAGMLGIVDQPGGIIPPMKNAESVLQNISSNPRSFEVAA